MDHGLSLILLVKIEQRALRTENSLPVTVVDMGVKLAGLEDFGIYIPLYAPLPMGPSGRNHQKSTVTLGPFIPAPMSGFSALTRRKKLKDGQPRISKPLKLPWKTLVYVAVGGGTIIVLLRRRKHERHFPSIPGFHSPG